MIAAAAGAVFAIPGDLDAPTGGYAYARRVLAEAPGVGLRLRVLTLPGDFPHPSAASVDATAQALAEVAPQTPILVDGLAFGALPEAALAAVRAPMACLLHHPLCLEAAGAPEAEALRVRESAALRHARAVIVTSRATRDDAASLLGLDPARATVAEPGLDPVAFSPPVAEDPPLILSVGSLIPRKGFDVLLEALARIGDLGWRAVLAGSERDVDCAAALRARIDAPDLCDRVALRGALDRGGIDALYRRAALFCLPSRHEGYGMVFAEAMAHGLPVVAADIAAAREVIPPAAGLRTPVDDPAALAEALRALLADPARRGRMGMAARAHARGLHGWDETARRIAAVLSALRPAP